MQSSDGMERLCAFRTRDHSLRLSASRISALAGFHPFACLPEIMMNLVYQGGQELLQHDANLLGIQMRSEESILTELATKAGHETAKLLKAALDVKHGKRVLDTVHIADQVKKKVLEEAKKSKKLNPEEIKVLKEGVRSSVDTGYGTYHEDEALNMYERQCGWEVRDRNAAVVAWPFAKAEDVCSELRVEQLTVAPISEATPMWKQSVDKEPAKKLDAAGTMPENAGIEDTGNETEQPPSRSEQDNPIDSVETSEMQSCYQQSGMNGTSNGGNVSRAQQRNAGNHRDGPKRPFFTIFGSVDGIREELWCPPCDGDKETSIFDEEWSLRQIIVECKHRMNKSFHSPPLYDQIQTTAYCLMYNVNDADIVQVVRKAKPLNARKKLKREDPKSENQSCSGRAAPEAVAADLASTKAESKLNCDRAMPAGTDVTHLASAKAESQTSSGLVAPESDPKDLTSTKKATDASNVPADVGNKENEKETSIGGGSADKKTIIEQSQGGSQTGDNSEPQTNDVSAAGEVAVTPKEQQADSNEMSSSATVEINVKRVSLDDPVMQHRRNWNEVVLPRLRSFVEAVYRIRADNDKRYRLLSGMSDPSGNSEAWNVLHEECPWLKDCDTAFLRDIT